TTATPSASCPRSRPAAARPRASPVTSVAPTSSAPASTASAPARTTPSARRWATPATTSPSSSTSCPHGGHDRAASTLRGARRVRFERRTRLARSRPRPQDRPVSLHRLAGVGVLLTACAPPIEPAWLVSRPRELALEVEVVAQGPYGRRLQPGPRTYRDALPRDTLSLRPVIVDPQGSMDLAAFEIAW